MRVFFNEDWIHYLWTRYEDKIDVGYDDLASFIHQYQDTSITDFVLNVSGTVSSSLSDVLETWSDKYTKTTENGVGVDYKDTFAKLHYQITQTKGLDMYAVWVEELKKIGVNPWLSFRMNDCHNNMDLFPHLRRGECVNAHPEWWTSAGREAKGYFDKCFNYFLPDVQELMLRYIEEQVSRYDVYGIELDFMREPFCLPLGFEEQARDTIVSFVGSVKELVNAVAAKRKKEIKLGIICQANPISAYNNGFDMARLAEQGLVDFVTAAPRWQTIRTDFPIEIWKKLLGENISFGCMQQLLVASKPSMKSVMTNVSMSFGQAAAFSDCGADHIYLYNYFDIIEPGLESYVHDTCFREKSNLQYVLSNIGKMEEKHPYTRRCPITFDDSVCLFENINARLPLPLGGFYKPLRFVTGKIEEDQRAYLILGFRAEIAPTLLDVYVAGQRAALSEVPKEDKNILASNAYTFQIPVWQGNTVVAELYSSERYLVDYAEILIEGI